MGSQRVLVVGGGLAGISAALALADAGLSVRLFERRALLGGRASSFADPDSGELVDHCQHVTMRCCTEFESLLVRLGAASKIAYQEEIPLLDAEGRRSRIRSSVLPAPLHLFPSLLAHRSLGFSQKLSLARAMWSLLREGPEFAAQRGKLFSSWLRDRGQGAAHIRAFWEPLLVSALNESIERMEARAALRVVYRGLLARRDGWQVGLPGAALAEITAKPGLEALRRAGVDVLAPCAIQSVEHARKGTPFRLRFAGAGSDLAENAQGEILVLAVAPHQLTSLLPPEFMATTPFAQINAMESSPIVAAHLWFDRQLLDSPCLALLGRRVQWIFRQPGNRLVLVVSAARELEAKDKDEILQLCLADLEAALPQAREARLLRSRVVKERWATFAATPQGEAARPETKTPISGLFLAGDWIDTGWPATMEGAVRGGLLAAQAVAEFAGISKNSRVVSQPCAARLVRWLARG